MPKCRKAKKRSPIPKFHIYCEGEKTEPNYLEDYIKNHCESFRLIQLRKIGYDEVVHIPSTNKTDPCSLVNLAIQDKTREADCLGDEFWCVYDREAENAVPEIKHKQAWESAMGHGIHVALSNVCFEFWLLLHKQYTTAAYCSYDDLYRRSQLTKWYKGYAKGEKRVYADNEIQKARDNAKRLLDNADRSGLSDLAYRMNPYTNVHELLSAIDTFFKRNDIRHPCKK